MLRCAQMHRDHFPVGSSSSATTYRVTMFRDDELPACDCIAFATRRNKNANQAGGGHPGAGAGLAKRTAAWCKHLEEVKNETCDWEQAPGEPASPSCPSCGGPVVDAGAPRLPAGRGPVSSEDLLNAANPAKGAGRPGRSREAKRPAVAAPSGERPDADAAAAELAELLRDA